jgi:Cu2+-exporting ATPase
MNSGFCEVLSGAAAPLGLCAVSLVAAAAMSGSSLLVILNALRAHRGTREQT